jgi:hypothetical protein
MENTERRIESIAVNLMGLHYALSFEESSDYVELYKAAFGEDGLACLNNEVLSLHMEKKRYEKMQDNGYEIDSPEELDNDIDSLLGTFERMTEKHDNEFEPYDSFIEHEKKKISNFTNELDELETGTAHMAENVWIKKENLPHNYFLFSDEILKHKFRDRDVIFSIFSYEKENKTAISCKSWNYELKNNLFHGGYDIEGNADIAKKIVGNVIRHFENAHVDEYAFDSFLVRQAVQKPHDRQLETAQKTGYVQGVCESVLAFNNDENRKLMSESNMAFLSKKLLSEMNVTKDMAQKFANPETYKALEQCLFTPEREQNREQMQSLERKGQTW